MRSPWRDSPRRRLAWFALIAVVVVAHLMFGITVAASVIGWNSAEEPRRIDVSLVRQLTPSAPPEVAEVPAAPVATPRPAHAVRVARASSAPLPAASTPDDAASAAASRAALDAEALALAASAAEPAAAASAAFAPEPAASAPSAAEAASAAPTAVAAASSASANAGAVASNGASAPVAGPPRPSFEWPPSTRLTYTLTGLYRNGPLYGSATVEWRRAGTHYQVQFDIHVSPFFDQHMLSDGEITASGLSPRHYDESFKVPIADPRNRRIEFGDVDVTLNTGARVGKLPQTQDGASQFVQFVWMFATNPAQLKPGNIVEIPLALPGSLRRWHYQVVATDRLAMPFGPIEAVHLKPMMDGPRRSGEYPFEIWSAPTLQYLPVRILVQVDERNFADLSLDQLPLQAAPSEPGAVPSPKVVVVPPPPLPKSPPFGER